MHILIANVINFFGGICSITSVQGKNKNQIVLVEFIGSILRIVANYNTFNIGILFFISFFNKEISLVYYNNKNILDYK